MRKPKGFLEDMVKEHPYLPLAIAIIVLIVTRFQQVPLGVRTIISLLSLALALFACYVHR